MSREMYGRVPNLIEGKHFSLFCMCPTGTNPLHSYFNREKIQNLKGYASPFDWAKMTREISTKKHILVLHDPIKRQRHASFIKKRFIKEASELRNSDFYRFYFHPYLAQLDRGDFSVVLFEDLEEYIGPLDFRYQEAEMLFPIVEELERYEHIRNNREILSVENWKEHILNLQAK